MHQVFSEQLPSIGQSLRLGGEERHYLGRALRARPGEKLRVADGKGRGVIAELKGFEQEEALLQVLAQADDVPEHWRLSLTLCPPRGDAMDEALDASVQLGVEGLALLRSQRTLANFDGAAMKPERLTRRLQEACRQCERSGLPTLRGPLAWDAFLAPASMGLKLVASERGGLPLAQAVLGQPEGARMEALVGPEGGFSSNELAQLQAAGWTPVTLGPRALRVPVAVAAFLAGLRTLQPAGSGLQAGPWAGREEEAT